MADCSVLEPMAKRLRLENFIFREQVSASSVLFVEKAPETARAEAQKPKRANELLVSLNQVLPVLDEARALGLLRDSGFDHSVDADAATPACSSKAERFFENDRYCKFRFKAFLDADLEIVYPAVRKDVEKKKAISLFRVDETPELYERVTLPQFVQNAAKWDQWVVEIVEGRKEQGDVLHSDDDFLVVKDYKWTNTGNLDECHYLAIFRDFSVRSLRSLEGKHLSILERIRDEAPRLIRGKWGFAQKAEALQGKLGENFSEERQRPPQLISFVHYHPTFWYFHVHIVSTRHSMFTNASAGEGLLLTAMDRFHKLDGIIELLKLRADYYQTCTLTTVLREPNAKLYLESV